MIAVVVLIMGIGLFIVVVLAWATLNAQTPHGWSPSPEPMEGLRHAAIESVPAEALLADDPELHLVHADMAAWHEAHPCTCEEEPEDTSDCTCV